MVSSRLYPPPTHSLSHARRTARKSLTLDYHTYTEIMHYILVAQHFLLAIMMATHTRLGTHSALGRLLVTLFGDVSTSDRCVFRNHYMIFFPVFQEWLVPVDVEEVFNRYYLQLRRLCARASAKGFMAKQNDDSPDSAGEC